MRHNDARKWLHAVLDLLPVLLIPVFMIYSHRHTMTNQTTVDIQYKYQSNEVNTIDDLVVGNVYDFDIHTTWSDDKISNFTFKVLSFNDNDIIQIFQSVDEDLQLDDNIGIYYACDSEMIYTFELRDNNDNIILSYDIDDIAFDYLIVIQVVDISNITIISGDISSYFYKTNFNVIDNVDVNDETSSVMNVFVDNFNNAINKYFNMGNVFNMRNVYEWFNTNIFNGQAPTIMFSVYNIIVYEFIMDLLFLLYGLFMWFIDMCKHLIEKPFRSIK